jgi:hypothetical protein
LFDVWSVSIERICSTVVECHVISEMKFQVIVVDIAKKIIRAIQVFRMQVKLKLFSIPCKLNYAFNIQEIFRIVQDIVQTTRKTCDGVYLNVTL